MEPLNKFNTLWVSIDQPVETCLVRKGNDDGTRATSLLFSSAPQYWGH